MEQEQVKYYMSAYTKIKKEVNWFKNQTFNEQYNYFVYMANYVVSCDCKGLLLNLIEDLAIPTVNPDIKRITTLYTVAAFINPFSIRTMKSEYINFNIAEIVTKSKGQLVDDVPKTVITAAMYARKFNSEQIIAKSIDSIIEEINATDFDKLLETINAKNHFGVELEFIPDCDIEFILKYINEVLNKCYPKTITNNPLFVMAPDSSAPYMYEIKTPPIRHKRELALLFTITLCLGNLADLEFIRITDGCGTHVHIDSEDRDYNTRQAIENAYLDNITVINRLMPANRLFNSYCLPTPCSRRLKEEDLLKMSKEELNKYRYHVVNINAWFYFKTIEFRQYEGTADIKSLLSWIEFLHKFIQNYNKIGICINCDTLFNNISLSKSSARYFSDKFIENHRLF